MARCGGYTHGDFDLSADNAADHICRYPEQGLSYSLERHPESSDHTGKRRLDPIALQDFFLTYDYYPLRTSGKKKEVRKPKTGKEMAKPKEKKKPGKRWHYGMIIKVLRTFRIKKLWLNVDTGDYTWNALLFPAFYFLSGENRSLRINFQDDNEGVLMVQNRLYRIIHACISSYSKS